MGDKLILADGIEFSTDDRETHINNNICIVGTTGSGKTLNLIQPRLLYNEDTNMVISDPKRELILKYRYFYEQLGFTVLELNISNSKLADVCFDPMQYIDCHKDVNMLSRAIVDLTPQRPNSIADCFWENSACNVVKFAIYYKLALGSSPTLIDVVDFIDNLDIDERNTLMSTNVDDVVEEIKKNFPDHPMLAPYNSFKTAPIRTAGSIFTTIKTTLSNVFSENIKRVISEKDTLDLDKFIKEKRVLFITTDGSDEYEDAFINLIFDMIIQQLTKIADTYPDQRLPIPVHFIFDDFAAGTKISSFPRQISKFRSKNMSSTIVLQSETQLEGMYGVADAKTIINNNDTLIYLGGNDVETAKDIAVRLNCPIENVLYMPLDQICIFRRGSKPIVAKKYPTLQDKMFIKLNNDYENQLSKADKEQKSNELSSCEVDLEDREIDEENLQAELEAKFDELFGTAS
ncbi:MAG: type IV secretory system conjugative DNA transfer family protein [Eubacterium sp.]|nr:type IV secretory system conjugative DNA transfer family protein [Eubacterium sp.]